MAKLTLEEKRLKSLKLQLFGKEQNAKPVINPKQDENSKQTAKPLSYPASPQTTLSYVKTDLFKIMFLIIMALSVQLILYFANSQNLVKLNFF